MDTVTTTTANIGGPTYVQIEPACSYCGYYHEGTCPRVEELEYYPDGALKRVRLRPEPASPFPLPTEPSVPDDQVGHTCGVDCPQTVW